MTEPCDIDAVELRRLIGAGDLSPVELLESCLARIEAVNGAVNAIVAMDVARARSEAKAAEAAVRKGAALPTLHGLPIGIKDLNATEGLRTTYGSLLHADNVPTADEGMVKRLRAAGAIVLAKTNTPEFGAGSNTTNKVYGATRNPFDLQRTSGGSSGGSAAAVATGMLPLAQGGDTFGSLRAPATWCGVVGFRPTPGLIAREGRSINYTNFSVQGPMARNVRDAALMMTGLVGYDARDAMSVPSDANEFLGLEAADLTKLRVAWSDDFGGVAPLDDDIRASFADGLKALGGAFKSFERRDPETPGVRDVLWTLRCYYYLINHTERVRDHADKLSPNIIANVRAGETMTLADGAAAERAWAKIYAAFQTFFADIDLLILPGNAVSPFKLADGIPKVVGGRPMENYVDASLVRSVITLTGHPVIAIPLGRDRLGLPFGIQVVGPRRADKFTLAAAAALEDHLQKSAATARPHPTIEDLSS
jgi:amidase